MRRRWRRAYRRVELGVESERAWRGERASARRTMRRVGRRLLKAVDLALSPTIGTVPIKSAPTDSQCSRCYHSPQPSSRRVETSSSSAAARF